MTTAWCWLNDNSGALQSIASLLGVLLTLSTIFLLAITWIAVKRQALASEAQAEAARTLTKVAIEQTNAAIDAAASAKRQSDLFSAQIEQSLAPLLVAEPDDRDGSRAYKLVSRGPGVAFKVYVWRGGPEERKLSPSLIAVQPSTLGPGSFAYLLREPTWDVFTVIYKGMDREERYTVVYRDPFKAQEFIMRRGLQEVYL